MNEFILISIFFAALATLFFYLGTKKDTDADKEEIISAVKSNADSINSKIDDLGDVVDKGFGSLTESQLNSERRIFDLEKRLEKLDEKSLKEPPLINNFSIAQKLRSERKYNEAIEVLKSILNQSLSYENKALVNFEIGLNYNFLNNIDESIKFYHLSLSSLEEVSERNEITNFKCFIYVNLGIAEQRVFSQKKAFEYFIKAEKCATEVNDKGVVGLALIGKGDVLKKEGKTKEVIQLYEEALKLFKDKKDAYHVAIVLQRLAIVFSEINETEMALSIYDEMLTVTKDNKFVFLAADAHLGKGINFLNQEKLELAETHLKQALAYYELTDKEKNYSAYAYGNLGILEFKKGNTNSSLRYHQKALKLSEELNDLRGIANEKANLGKVLSADQRFGQGLDYLREALSIHEKIGNQFAIATDYALIGALHLDQSKIDENAEEQKIGIKNLIQARDIFEKIGNETKARAISEVLKEYGVE